MGNKLRIYSTGLAAIALVLFLILVSSAATAAPLTITETRITTSGSASNPEIYEDKIVWQDIRNGGSDVYTYDTSTNTETRITTSGSAYNPAIYENLIVYEKHEMPNPDEPWNTISDIYMYDLSVKKEIRITTSGSTFNPDIYGNNIVWDGGGIYLYDLYSNKVTKIAENYVPVNDGSDYPEETSWSCTNPTIYGNRITWLREGSISAAEPFTDIGIYDLTTKKETYIGENWWARVHVYARSPDIFNNRIVWNEWKHEESEEPGYICMYDLTTNKVVQFPLVGYDPRIYGDRIVWDNSVYDLSAKSEIKIATGGSASNPRIYGDRIVWEDNRNGGSDIYMATLSSSDLPETVEAEIYFSPKTLNLRSGGQWVTVYIELPEKYAATGIDVSSVLLNGAVSAVTDMKCNFVTDKREYLTDTDRDGIPERMLKFDRKAIGSVLKKGDKVNITIMGKVEYNNGISSSVADFKGSDVIRVIKSDSKKSRTK